MRGWGVRLGRRWVAGVMEALAIPMSQKKRILRAVVAGGDIDRGCPGLACLLAWAVAKNQSDHPGVFLAFPFAILAIAANAIASLVNALIALV